MVLFVRIGFPEAAQRQAAPVEGVDGLEELEAEVLDAVGGLVDHGPVRPYGVHDVLGHRHDALRVHPAQLQSPVRPGHCHREAPPHHVP